MHVLCKFMFLFYMLIRSKEHIALIGGRRAQRGPKLVEHHVFQRAGYHSTGNQTWIQIGIEYGIEHRCIRFMNSTPHLLESKAQATNLKRIIIMNFAI